MQVKVRVVPGAKKNLVKEEAAGIIKVYVTAQALEGKANKAILPVLAKHFGVKKSQVNIIKGLKSKNKTINIYN